MGLGGEKNKIKDIEGKELCKRSPTKASDQMPSIQKARIMEIILGFWCIERSLEVSPSFLHRTLSDL